MRLSKLADYGIAIMVFIARRGKEICSVREISLNTRISIAMVSKILKMLAKSGHVMSHRGVMGGYAINGSPEDISLAKIINCLEQRQGFTQCSIAPNACSLQKWCEVQSGLQIISNIFEGFLDNISLQLLANTPEKLLKFKNISSGVLSG